MYFAYRTLAAAAVCGLLASCAELGIGPAPIPESVSVPAGNSEFLRLLARGEVIYECRVRPSGGFQWTVLAPSATLYDASGTAVGRYYGGPVWELKDGSRVMGRQVAVARAAPHSGALQLVKATSVSSKGRLSGVTYVQRLNTRGGSAPAGSCSDVNAGSRQSVPYEADYAFHQADKPVRSTR